MLTDTYERYAPLRACVSSALSALARNTPTVFHAEIFWNAGRPLVCEIAARPGGGPLVAAISAATGVDLSVAAAIAQAGALQSSAWTSSKPAAPKGYLMFPKVSGRVATVPSQAPSQQITDYRPYVRVGDDMGAAKNVNAMTASMVVHPTGDETAYAALEAARTWFAEAFRLDTGLVLGYARPLMGGDVC